MKLYLLSVLAIFLIAFLGIMMNRLYRQFAQKNPQLGPFRETEGCGCCGAQSMCEKIQKQHGSK